jgi:glycine/D-amino acid oxidase-like deaminating enzyme
MTQKIIVVGAGVVGGAIAANLAGAGAEVLIVEAAGPAAGASGKSFGWVNASFAETPAYFRLRLAALEAHAALGLPRGARGSLWWEDQGPAFETQAARLASLGYAVRRIGRAEVAALEPGLADPPEACLQSTLETAVDGAALAGHFLARATAAGARLMVGARVRALLRGDGGVTGVETDFGRFAADMVVLAAGRGSEALAAGAGVHLPLAANQPGLILQTQPVRRVVSHLILSPDIHFHQLPDGRIFAGEIFSGGSASVAEAPMDLAAELLARLQARLPGAGPLALGQVTVAERPVPADGMPAVGPAPGCTGLYIATMHSGVTLAALIGRIAAAEIAGGTPDPALAEFRPDRFSKGET